MARRILLKGISLQTLGLSSESDLSKAEVSLKKLFLEFSPCLTAFRLCRRYLLFLVCLCGRVDWNVVRGDNDLEFEPHDG